MESHWIPGVFWRTTSTTVRVAQKLSFSPQLPGFLRKFSCPNKPCGSQFKEKSCTLQLKNPPPKVREEVFRSRRSRQQTLLVDEGGAFRRKATTALATQNGKITVKKKKQVFNADLGSKFKLQQTFTRRGLALNREGILTFKVHKRLVRNYFFLASRGVETAASPLPQACSG